MLNSAHDSTKKGIPLSFCQSEQGWSLAVPCIKPQAEIIRLVIHRKLCVLYTASSKALLTVDACMRPQLREFDCARALQTWQDDSSIHLSFLNKFFFYCTRKDTNFARPDSTRLEDSRIFLAEMTKTRRNDGCESCLACKIVLLHDHYRIDRPCSGRLQHLP